MKNEENLIVLFIIKNIDSLCHVMYTSFKFKLLCVSIEL